MDRKVKIIRAFASVVLLAGLVGLTSCEKYIWSPPEVPQDIIISFSGHIYPLCNSCHSSWTPTKVYNELLDRVNITDPPSSNILTFHSTVVETNMIRVNADVTLKASEVIKLWATQGALNN